MSTPRPGPPPGPRPEDPLAAAEARLAEVEQVPVEEHVAAFTDVDALLRQALQPPAGGGG